MVNMKTASMAPDFTATDSEGKTLRLSDYRGKKNVVLVFNRGFG
jgi:peroxiredoxin